MSRSLNGGQSVERLSLSRYVQQIEGTDVLDPVDINPILQGLYGEVGGIMSTAKKHVREKSAYPGFKRAAEEEFGDTLWYLVALCKRLSIPMSEVFSEVADHLRPEKSDAQFFEAKPHSEQWQQSAAIDQALFRLGESAAALMKEVPGRALVSKFAEDYLAALGASHLVLAEVMGANAQKVRGAFLPPDPTDLRDFDADFDVEEQLPREFRVRVSERRSGRSYLQWNGVFIGDPLTDNIADPDGYRFHDVFHFAYAAILHWSPVVRALIKHKRKSRPEYDEEQDSGRAIVVEEGLTAWIFVKAKELDYFQGQKQISLGTLKTVSQFVSGYEVSSCPLKLWERAILDGYGVFRCIRANRGGWIIGDRTSRTIRYESLG